MTVPNPSECSRHNYSANNRSDSAARRGGPGRARPQTGPTRAGAVRCILSRAGWTTHCCLYSTVSWTASVGQKAGNWGTSWPVVQPAELFGQQGNPSRRPGKHSLHLQQQQCGGQTAGKTIFFAPKLIVGVSKSVRHKAILIQFRTSV